MKWKYRLILAIALFLFFIPNVSAWYDNSWNYKSDVTVSSTTRPYQLMINISNNTGTNNATHIYCNGHCNTNFTDIRFTLNDVTLLPHWMENATGYNATTGIFWVNLTTTGTIQMYYGNTGASSASDGNTTFPIFDHFTEASLNSSKWTSSGSGGLAIADSNLTLTDPKYIRSLSQYSSGYFMRVRARFGADTDDHIYAGWMASFSNDKTKFNIPFRSDAGVTHFSCVGGKDSSGYVEYEYAATRSLTNWNIAEYRRGGTADYCYLNEESDHFHPTRYSTNNRYLAAQAYTSDIIVDWILMGNYNVAGPTWGTWGAEVSGHVTYDPPAPVGLANTSGTDWVNYTWSAGTGNITDQYTVCLNLYCYNSSLTYANTTLYPHMWSNITVRAINNSNNTRNETTISSTYQNPNTAPVLTYIGNKKIYQDKTISVQLSATDSDEDTANAWYPLEAELYSDYATSGWTVYCNPERPYSGLCMVDTSSVSTPLTMNFTGTKFKLIYSTSSGRGIMNINVDGGTNTSLDLYSANASYRNELLFSGLTNQKHTINFYWTGTMNTLSSSNLVEVDAIEIPYYRFEAENNTNCADWGVYTNTSSSAYSMQNTCRVTIASNPILFNFNGTNINTIFTKSSSRGIMNYTIDSGANTSIDEYSASTAYQQETNNSLALSPGAHTARFYWTGTNTPPSSDDTVDVDALDVEMQGWYGTNATKGTLNATTGLYTWTPGIADVGNYTWSFNYTDGWGGVDTEVITVSVKANRLITVDLDNAGWQTMLVNDTQTFLSLDTLLSPTYLAIWNSTSQAYEKYKSGWLYRSTQSITPDNALMVLVSADSSKTLNITHAYNYTLLTGQNLIGFPENITLSAINSSVNVDGNCTNVDEINYIYPNMTERTYSCVSGSSQENASVMVADGRGAWLNAVRNVTILDALG